MRENKDVSIVKDDMICVVYGKRIYEWEHIEHIILYVNIHKECAKKLKHKTKFVAKRRFNELNRRENEKDKESNKE
ncbi:MAG: hypothetical protein QW478_04305 [Candidatus Micrarchaeaceae archaeon]